ncbi:MAG: hypothetical protein CMJ80_12415 [Planctomycetaceae bacterium]|nr:hypothetical protein [Planctomycetaceae bacterium]
MQTTGDEWSVALVGAAPCVAGVEELQSILDASGRQGNLFCVIGLTGLAPWGIEKVLENSDTQTNAQNSALA